MRRALLFLPLCVFLANCSASRVEPNLHETSA